ncbi:uncharacterized protein LOC117644047 [Thrips palmi]|uniref:Uncharacterized protein LOC117644047 n=1 Tax=Thrips palmi TaxID=161013 RepID=A0A6P8ZLM7_THRPL|nr:uncharacterized protein LOC117644047 [Thrips palmi]
MECDVCMQLFDSAERRPKSLPCGHTYCLSCLEKLAQKECPVDKKVFQVDKLVDNFMLLNATNKPARFWCIDCEREATDGCIDEHAVRSLKQERTRTSEPLLEALRRGEAALSGMARVVYKADVDLPGQTKVCVERLKREVVRLGLARHRLLDALEGNVAVWEQAKEAAVQVQSEQELSETAALLAADLLDPSSSWTLRRAAGGPVAWTGEVRPAEDAAARLLLCGLAFSGGLRVQKQDPGLEPEQRPEPQLEHREVELRWQDSSNRDEMSVEDMAARMTAGSRVVRGRDWVCEDEDGDPPGPGTIDSIEIVEEGEEFFDVGDKQVNVIWDNDSDRKIIWYRMGSHEQYELRLVPLQLKPNIGAEEKVLEVSSVCFSTNMKPKWKLLSDNNLEEVRTLLNLHCDVHPLWSLLVLQEAAPRLKALQLVSPQQQHLDAALAMPLLEGLCVCNVTGPQLQQVVRMASLRRLELHCPPDAPLPVLAFPGPAAGLRWLRCGVHPLVTALALELKKMVLLRRDAYDSFCRHDEKSCKKQVAQITYFFYESDLCVDVLCSVCNEGCE